MKENNNKTFNKILIASLSLIFVAGGFLAVSASDNYGDLGEGESFFAKKTMMQRNFKGGDLEKNGSREGFQAERPGIMNKNIDDSLRKMGPESCELFASLSEEEKAEKLEKMEVFKAEREAFRAEREAFRADKGLNRGLACGGDCDGMQKDWPLKANK